jgi:hypothetical protein
MKKLIITSTDFLFFWLADSRLLLFLQPQKVCYNRS